MLNSVSAGVSYSPNFLACRRRLGKRRIFRAVRLYRMAKRVPGAVQRALRCTAEPGPIHDPAPWTPDHKCGGFDIRFSIAARPPSECQIQNSTRNLYLLVVLLILTFAKAAAEKGCEC